MAPTRMRNLWGEEIEFDPDSKLCRSFSASSFATLTVGALIYTVDYSAPTHTAVAHWDYFVKSGVIKVILWWAWIPFVAIFLSDRYREMPKSVWKVYCCYRIWFRDFNILPTLEKLGSQSDYGVIRLILVHHDEWENAACTLLFLGFIIAGATKGFGRIIGLIFKLFFVIIFLMDATNLFLTEREFLFTFQHPWGRNLFLVATLTNCVFLFLAP